MRLDMNQNQRAETYEAPKASVMKFNEPCCASSADSGNWDVTIGTDYPTEEEQAE